MKGWIAGLRSMAGAPAANGPQIRPLRWPGVVALAGTIGLTIFQVLLTGTVLPFDLPRMPAVRSSLCAVVLLVVATSVNALANGYAGRGRTKWWDGADKPDGELAWSEVFALVSAARELDPLASFPSRRSGARPGEGAWLFVSAFALAAVASQALAFLWDPWTPWWLLKDDRDAGFTALVSVSGNLTAYLALLTSVVAIVFTYHQLRAKVRADSRQQWIGTARALVAETLALRTRRSSLWPGSVPARERLEQVRLELELMLNPSERDHRLLMYLVQRLSFLNDAGLDSIQDAVAVRHEILKSGAMPGRPSGISYDEPDGGPTHPSLGQAWNEILYANREGDLVSYVMRLSHAVLKREWERVKHTR